MKIKQSIGMIMGAMLLAPGMAFAAPQCFQEFTGVYLRFEQPVTDSTVARNGRVWELCRPAMDSHRGPSWAILITARPMGWW